MKTTLLAISFCLCINSVQAQITISNSDMPVAGDSVRVSYAATTNSIDHTLTGPNYFWDFSTLIPNAQEELRFPAPSALPFNFISTIAVVNLSPDSLPFIGSVPNNFTDYYKNGSSGYRKNGLSFEYAPLGNFTVPVIYSSSDYVFRFPLNYGDLDTSDGAYNFNIPNLAYIGQTIHRESNVDGWGTLVTPFATYQCLRVVSYVSVTDTIGLDSLTGFTIPRPVEVQYKWMANGMKIPVLEIDATVIASTEIVSNVAYQDSLNDSLFQVGMLETTQNIINARLYPNPTSENINVTYFLFKSGNVEINLIDLSGRKVKSLKNGFQTEGAQNIELYIGDFSDGMYFLQIVTGSSILTQKVIVNH